MRTVKDWVQEVKDNAEQMHISAVGSDSAEAIEMWGGFVEELAWMLTVSADIIDIDYVAMVEEVVGE